MNALVVNNISKIFRGSHHALKEVSFSVKTGSFFGLLGLNGAGKSTLIRILSTLISPSGGEIALFELPNMLHSPQKARTFLGIMPQEINLSIFETVEQVLIMEAYFYGLKRTVARDRIHHLLEELDLLAMRNKRIGALSGGMKRKVMLARALLCNPRLLICDEPTTGLDIEARKKVWALLSSLNLQGMTIVLTSHYLEEIETLCSDIGLLHEGRLLFCQPTQELLQKSNVPMGWTLSCRDWPPQSSEKISKLGGILRPDHTIYIENKERSESVFQEILRFHEAGFKVTAIHEEKVTLEKLLLDLQKSSFLNGARAS